MVVAKHRRAFICLVVGVLALAGQSAAAATLRLCRESSSVRPWLEADGKGLNINLLDRVASTLRLKISYETSSWKRCLAMLRSNEVDGVIGASFTPERMAAGVFPGEPGAPDAAKRLNTDRYVLVRRRGSSLSWDGQQIHNLHGALGAQLGYSVVDQMRALGVPVDDGSVSAEELLQKLLRGRVEGACLMEGELMALLHEHPDWGNPLEIVAAPLSSRSYFLMLSHRLADAQPHFAQAIWNTIEVERNSRDYQALERRALQGTAP